MKHASSLITFVMALSSVFAQEMSEVEKEKARFNVAYEMQQNYQREGLDIEVLPMGRDHALIMRSDLFKDIQMREAQVNLVMRDREVKKALCNIGLWTLQVGYSKGVLSSDVMKTVSLGCPAEKAANQQREKAERERYAANTQRTLAGHDIHVSVRETTLIFASENIFSVPSSRSAFAQSLLADPLVLRQLCGMGFTQIQVKSGGPTRTTPILCGKN